MQKCNVIYIELELEILSLPTINCWPYQNYRIIPINYGYFKDKKSKKDILKRGMILK